MFVEWIEEGSGRGGWSLGHAGRKAVPEAERSDAARNRRRILRTTRALFERKGVTRVTMEEIARAAGVGKGTLYRRFANKALLCQALLDAPTREFQGEVLQTLGEAGKGTLQKLDSFLDRLVRFTEENLDLLYGGHANLPGAERLAHFDSPAYDWRRSTVLGLLRAAVRDRELDESLDVEYVAAALLAPLDVDFFYHQRRVQRMPAERISAGLRSLVPRGK